MTPYSIISVDKPKSYAAEQYKKIRTAIEVLSISNNTKVINITSGKPSEGKTTTAANLGITLATSNKRILLIDFDIKKPKLHRYFNLLNENGLTEYYLSNECIENYIISINENLDIITAGKERNYTSEIISSNKIKELIEELKDVYDFILLDSSPVVVATDASLTSMIADGTLFVIDSTSSDRRIVKSSIQELESHGVNVIGSILIKVPMKAINYGNGYYSYYEEDND